MIVYTIDGTGIHSRYNKTDAAYSKRPVTRECETTDEAIEAIGQRSGDVYDKETGLKVAFVRSGEVTLEDW